MSRGSQWKKWDFHVHTPASVLNSQFGNNWDDYVSNLFKKAIEKNIAAIGITDYLSIEGYKKIKTEYLEVSEKMDTLFNEEEITKINNILIFPNIEFRLKKYIGESAINFHIFFSNEVSISNIEDNFLHELIFEFSASPGASPETRRLTKSNLEDLGRRLQNEHERFRSDPSIIFTGTNNAKVDDSNIVEVLNSKDSIFKNKYFFAIPSDEDLSSIPWNSQGHNDRKLLIQKSHFIMSGNSNTVKWGLGEFNASEEEYIVEFKSIKPTIWGSDAHDFDKLFEPDLHRYTWVKSENTFEGIRQVLFEPKRIKISNTIPSSKNLYQVMKEIKFIDQSNEIFKHEFAIGLNPDLNSIIGGKSSGKSLLLFHIAKTIMEKEKFETMTTLDGFQTYDDLTSIDLEILWEDGHISKLSGTDDKRPIVYIPQMYLNYMAEKRDRNKDFKETIEDILKSNDGYSEYLQEKSTQVLTLEKEVDNNIKNFFSEKRKLHNMASELSQLGDKNAILQNIEQIKDNLVVLKNNSGFTDEEIQQYTELIEDNKIIDKRRSDLILEKNLLSGMFEKTTNLKGRLEEFIKEEYSELKYKYTSEHFINIIDTSVSQLIYGATSSVTGYLETFPFNTTYLDTKIESINSKIIANNTLLEPLNRKIRNSEVLKQKEEELKNEEAKVALIDLKIEEIRTQGQLVGTNLITEKYEELFNVYKSIKEKNDDYKDISSSIELFSEVSFNAENFKRDFSDFITKNRTLESIFNCNGFDGNNFNLDVENHTSNINHICNELLNNNDISFNQSKNIEEILPSLFKNYFDISYDLIQEGDRLGHMSPGKKGIILFQLFLHMSSSKNPILIDQPEDNLDNRTVYQELNDFIKEKKIERQIIIVSHNSNLVVSTDSENIIVAHQNSLSSERPKFEYINGPLENTYIDNDPEKHILEKQGIREHVCEILEGGVEAFKKREEKYNIGNR